MDIYNEVIYENKLLFLFLTNKNNCYPSLYKTLPINKSLMSLVNELHHKKCCICQILKYIKQKLHTK